MIGGLIGGLIGGAAAWLALTYLLPPEAGELEALRARVEQLDQRVGNLPDTGQGLAELTGRIETLEQAPPAADAGLAARVEALETARADALEQVQAGAPAGAGDQAQAGPALAALEQRVGALEEAASAAQGSAAAGGQDDLQTRLAELESRLAGLATDVAGADDAAAGEVATLDALQSRLSAVENSLAGSGAGGTLGQRVEALGARVDALEPTEAKLAELAGDLQQAQQQGAGARSQLEGLVGEVQGLGGQVQALHGDLEGLQNRVADVQNRAATAGDRRELAAALALMTSQIDTALGREQRYDAPLRSLTALGGQDEVVSGAAAELTPRAATGVPSLAALRESFAAVAGEIVRRARAPEGDSLLDQAASNLLGLVTVRPVGADVEGEGAAARVARAEAALAAGDLAAAVAELEGLDGPAAEAAAGWLAEAKARLQATTALARLQAHTTELLTPTTD